MVIPVNELIGIFICLVLSGFFSGSETALTALSEVRLEKLLEKHPKWARPLLLWRKNPNGVLTTILVGNNLVNITASALATELADKFFESGSGIPIVVGVMTFLRLLFGEITPKTLARTYAEGLAPLLMHGVVVFHWIFSPIAWVLTKFVKGLIYILGIREKKGRGLTEEDIEFIVSMGRRQGVLDKEKEHLLTSVFEFSDTTVKEIMKPRTEMEALPLESTYEEMLTLAQQSGFSRIPVFDGSLDKIVGIFYAKSLLTPPRTENKAAFLRENLRPPVFVPESKKISELLRTFQKEQFHMAVVVDEFGGTEGIVTMEDIIEELLGEIHDEYDEATIHLVKAGEGKYSADARVNLDELEDELQIKFPDDREYETLGGFLMELSGEVPSKDWSREFMGYSFLVTSADPQRVLNVRITRMPSPEEKANTTRDSIGQSGAATE